MKQFLYLDTDIVNSIIAQSEKGIITGFSTEEENGEQKSTNKSISGNLEGDAGGKLLKVFNAELKLDIRGGIGTEKEVHSASREIITKTLHDAAFDIAYDSITPVCLTSNGQDQDDYGAYVELTRVFDVVDFDYLERIFSKGGLIVGDAEAASHLHLGDICGLIEGYLLDVLLHVGLALQIQGHNDLILNLCVSAVIL